MIRSGDSEGIAKQIRCLSLAMVHRANASHIGSALSIADIIAVLYSDVLSVNSSNPLDESRDRFILSKGHACVAVYAALAIRGYFAQSALDTYGEDGSNFMAHISHKVAGVEFSTGSLGHGLPFGVGKALMARTKGASWKTIVLVSDGELDEGSNWEAILFSAHHKLKDLILVVDYNNLQSLDSVENTLELEPLNSKFEAFGWEVVTICGHSHSQIRASFERAFRGERPTCILAQTTKGKGVSFMEGKIEWHYKSPNNLELAAALEELENA